MRKVWILALVGAVLLTLNGCGKSGENADMTEQAQQPAGVAVTYYHGDKWNRNLLEEETTVPRLTAQALVDLLIESETLKEGTRVRNFKVAQGSIILDLTKELEEASRGKGLGSSQEYVFMGSIVNTFLSNYDASTLQLTSEGRPLVIRSHRYDAPMQFYE